MSTINWQIEELSSDRIRIKNDIGFYIIGSKNTFILFKDGINDTVRIRHRSKIYHLKWSDVQTPVSSDLEDLVYDKLDFMFDDASSGSGGGGVGGGPGGGGGGNPPSNPDDFIQNQITDEQIAGYKIKGRTIHILGEGHNDTISYDSPNTPNSSSINITGVNGTIYYNGLIRDDNNNANQFAIASQKFNYNLYSANYNQNFEFGNEFNNPKFIAETTDNNTGYSATIGYTGNIITIANNTSGGSNSFTVETATIISRCSDSNNNYASFKVKNSGVDYETSRDTFYVSYDKPVEFDSQYYSFNGTFNLTEDSNERYSYYFFGRGDITGSDNTYYGNYQFNRFRFEGDNNILTGAYIFNRASVIGTNNTVTGLNLTTYINISSGSNIAKGLTIGFDISNSNGVSEFMSVEAPDGNAYFNKTSGVFTIGDIAAEPANSTDILQIYGTMRANLGTVAGTDTIIARNPTTGQFTNTAVTFSQLMANNVSHPKGRATMSGGSVTVSYAFPDLTANTEIFLTVTAYNGGTPGFLRVTINPGVSFTIFSTSVLESSTINWIMFN